MENEVIIVRIITAMSTIFVVIFTIVCCDVLPMAFDMKFSENKKAWQTADEAISMLFF
jgi:hypothetical protein